VSARGGIVTRQTNREQLERSAELLETLKKARGGSLDGGHRRLANDPALLRAFTDLYVDCCVSDTGIPEKYRQLILMALCCANGYDIAVNHGRKAVGEGATVEEMGEVIRLILNVCGCPAILPVMELFEETELDV